MWLGLGQSAKSVRASGEHSNELSVPGQRARIPCDACLKKCVLSAQMLKKPKLTQTQMYL